MTIVGLVVVALFLILFGLTVHAMKGAGAAVPGVPRWLWVVGFVTFNPLVVLSYVAFALRGVAAQALWRRWVVYVATTLGLLTWLLPVSVPLSGVYPRDSARPIGVLPSFGFTLSSGFGDSQCSRASSSRRGNGWAVRRAVIVSDGHPVSAHLTHAVAEALYSAGIHEVRFAQSDDALPAPAGELLASVSVLPAFRFDLGGAAFWSGDVALDIGGRPFGEDRFGPPRTFTDASSGELEVRWSVGAFRLGPAVGEAQYDFVLQQLGEIEALLSDLLANSGRDQAIAVPSDAGLGDGSKPALDEVFAPLQLQPVVAGPAYCADQVAHWRLLLGADPEADLRSLAERLSGAGWDRVDVEPGADRLRARTSDLLALQRVEGGRRRLLVSASKAALLRIGAYRGSTFRWDSVEEPRSDLPAPREYVVSFEQCFDKARLEALALRLLDGGGDDYVLRTLGRHVPVDRYDDWRSRVLAGDCGVANLLCVARQDRERGGRDPAVAALVEVAAWIAGSPGWGKGISEGLQDTVTRSAKSFGLAAPDFRASPALETLVRAGIPVLDERWRRLPGLLAERRPTRARDVAVVSRRGYSVRRFAVEGPAGTPAIVHLELVDRVDGPRLAVVDVDGRCINAELEEFMQEDSRGQRTFPRQRGVFELRRVDDRYEVRWRKAQ